MEYELWFSVSLFWPSRDVVKKQKKHRLQRWRTQKKANSAIVRQSECCLQEQDTEKVSESLAGEAMTPNNAPTKASSHPKPHDTPFTLKVENNSDTDIQSDSEELTVLDKM